MSYLYKTIACVFNMAWQEKICDVCQWNKNPFQVNYVLSTGSTATEWIKPMIG